jgi:hypothetical protein
MRKEIEISGCVEIPEERTADDFIGEFLAWCEERGYSFGGGFREIRDGYYILPDGRRGKPVSED